jgi:hypothetical protein
LFIPSSEHAANGEVNNLGNQNYNPVQRKANNDNESGDEYDGSDDEMRNHLEPLLSYHEDNQPHNQHNHQHVGKAQHTGTLNNTVGNFGSTLKSLPPLPDTMQLVHILQEIQRAIRLTRTDAKNHSEPLLS